MSVGFAMLAHDRLERAAAVARHLADQGAPVVVHLDARVQQGAVEEFCAAAVSGVTVLSTRAAEWGGFGLIDATLDCLQALMADDAPGHICLLSGSCLPIRPIAELEVLLAGNPTVDFIDSVPVAKDNWVVDGLSEERFTLHHWFSWRTSRRLFDLSVGLQRVLGAKRKMPNGLEAHLGSQWWCLSASTIAAILGHADLPAWKKFFRTVWIPDESFFQTIVRTVRPDADTRSPLHLIRWDAAGQPFVFHDDHAEVLSGAEQFFARKIDPNADRIYEKFLGDPVVTPRRQVCEAIFDAARRREKSEGKGRLSQSRYPGGTMQNAVQTAQSYVVLVGEDADLLARCIAKIADQPRLAAHGLLFTPDSVPLADGAKLTAGNLPASVAYRNYRPAQFLANLIWADAATERTTGFAFCPLTKQPQHRDLPKEPAAAIAGQIVGDGNARLILIGDQDALMNALRRPLPTKRPPRKPKLPREVWAWHAVLDDSDLKDDLDGRGSGDALDELRRLIGAPNDPNMWIVPDDGKAKQ